MIKNTDKKLAGIWRKNIYLACHQSKCLKLEQTYICKAKIFPFLSDSVRPLLKNLQILPNLVLLIGKK